MITCMTAGFDDSWDFFQKEAAKEFSSFRCIVSCFCRLTPVKVSYRLCAEVFFPARLRRTKRGSKSFLLKICQPATWPRKRPTIHFAYHKIVRNLIQCETTSERCNDTREWRTQKMFLFYPFECGDFSEQLEGKNCDTHSLTCFGCSSWVE
jgi:hypothetical protein